MTEPYDAVHLRCSASHMACCQRSYCSQTPAPIPCVEAFYENFLQMSPLAEEVGRTLRPLNWSVNLVYQQ